MARITRAIGDIVSGGAEPGVPRLGGSDIRLFSDAARAFIGVVL
jgi:hypothetical protein